MSEAFGIGGGVEEAEDPKVVNGMEAPNVVSLDKVRTERSKRAGKPGVAQVESKDANGGSFQGQILTMRKLKAKEGKIYVETQGPDGELVRGPVVGIGDKNAYFTMQLPSGKYITVAEGTFDGIQVPNQTITAAASGTALRRESGQAPPTPPSAA